MRKIQRQRRVGSKPRPRSLRLEHLDERLPLTGFVTADAATNVVPPAPGFPVTLQFEVMGTGSNDLITAFWDAVNFQDNYTVFSATAPPTAQAGTVQAGDIFSAALSYLVSPLNIINPLIGWAGFRLTGLGGHDTLDASGLLFQSANMFGGTGNDILLGGSQADVLSGGDGNDFLDGNAGADRSDGGTGDDTVLVDAHDAAPSDPSGKDTMVLDDTFGGVSTSNTAFEDVVGSASNDTVDSTGYVGPGWDPANGITGPRHRMGGGDDTVISSAFADIIDGEGGSDTASYITSPAGVDVNRLLDTAAGGNAAGDRLDSIENVTGSAHPDTLTGDHGPNVLNGLAGNDVLTGNGGNDTLNGGDNNDSLLGNDGDDSLSGGNDNDTLDGGANNDTLSGGNGNDVLAGGLGNDSLDGNAGSDALDGGHDNDSIRIDYPEIVGGPGVADTDIFGGPGNDTFNIFGTGDGIAPAGAGLDAAKVNATETALDDLFDAGHHDWDATTDVKIFHPVP
jgi:Ca2+-binding RTX toxin-like protein